MSRLVRLPRLPLLLPPSPTRYLPDEQSPLPRIDARFTHHPAVLRRTDRSFEKGRIGRRVRGIGNYRATPSTRDFGRHQFGITARETRDTTSKTARHATVRFSPRETRPRFRGHPAARRRIYHRDTIELELPEIIPSSYRGCRYIPPNNPSRCVYMYMCVRVSLSFSTDSISLIDSDETSETGKSVGNSEKFRAGLQPIFPNPPPIRAGSRHGIN